MSDTIDIAEPSVGDLVRRIGEDARRIAQAELEIRKRQVGTRVDRAKLGVVLVVVAIFLVQAALTALLVGLVIQLGPLVGPALGGLIVAVVVLVIAGIMAKVAVGRFTEAKP